VSARSVVATPVATAMSIDGLVNDPAWSSVPTVGDLIQREPKPGEPPTEKTDIKIAYNSTHLYIGVI
jgi:hypothetical protein